MHVQGIVAKYETKRDSFTNDRNEKVDYDFDLITFLVDGFDQIEIRVGKDQRAQTQHLQRGDEVSMEVDVPKGVKVRFARLNGPVAAKAG